VLFSFFDDVGRILEVRPPPKGDEPGERGDRVQEGDLSPRPELLLGPSRSEPSVERTGPVGPSECEGGDLNPYRSNPTRT
jgi:hypothetical protein